MFEILDERIGRSATGRTRKELLTKCACGAVAWRRAIHVTTGVSTQCLSCRSKTHGFSKHPLRGTWYAMWSRCTNPAARGYADYGGRGITVCTRWLQFDNFLADMGERPKGMTLERRDNGKGYEPSNCCWATLLEQGANQRKNVKVAAFGKVQHIAAWARELGVPQARIQQRLKKGYPPEQALIAGKWRRGGT
jgi:hypothetical protein